MIALALGLMGCSKNNDTALTEIKHKLTSDKVFSYRVNEFTIEGWQTGDTIFTTTTCSFQQRKEDSLCGFTYCIEDQLVHPIFKVPITLWNNYNGKSHIWNLDSEVKKDRKITEGKEITIEKIQRDVYGHIPYILHLLDSRAFRTVVRQEDTLFNNMRCMRFKAISSTGISNDLLIDKKTLFPQFLRIVENPAQPFIHEFNYSHFEFSDTLIAPAFQKLNTKTKPKEVLGVGDTFPHLELETTQGKHLQITESKGKTTLLFLSAIYCGWCQKAIPMVTKFYNKSIADNHFNCIVYYPDNAREKLMDYTKDKGIAYPIAFSTTKDPAKKHALREQIKYGFPTTIIINSQNEITWLKTGFSKELEKEIEKALKNSESHPPS